jgi:hypothetical protein
MNIEVAYRPLGLMSIRFNRSLPGNWDGFSEKQFMVVGDIYERKLSDHQAISRLLEMPLFIAKKLDPFQVFCLMERMDFISEYRPCSRFIILEIAGRRPPGVRLQGMSWGQFMAVDSYFNEHVQDKNQDALYKFIAALYTNGKFAPEEIQVGAKLIQKQNDLRKCQAIKINYRLVLEWLMGKYPIVFRRQKSDSSKPAISPDWVRIHDIVVGDDIANEDRYVERPVHNMLRYISRKIKENAKRR